MSTLPPEPDEFQTRMRQPEGSGDESTAQAGEQGPPAPAGSPFAPPGGATGAEPGQPSPAAPPAQPETAPVGYGQPTTPFGEASQPTAPFGQVSQPGGYGQPTQQLPPQGAPSGPFGQQPSGPPQQAPFGYPQHGGYGAPGQPVQPGQPGGWAQQPPRDANPFKAAFDFSFQSYATPGIVKIVYIIGVVAGVLLWLLYVILGFSVGALNPYTSSRGGSGTIFGVLALVLGWIPVLMWVLLLRVGLETALANVRTATDVRVLRTRSDEDVDKA